MTMSGWERWAARLLVPAVAVALLVAPPDAGAGAALGGFSATAAASGLYGRYGISEFLVVENFVDAGGPVAQAVVESSGRSESFASLPYPGPTVIGYPGLAAIALGSAPPGYPLYAHATHPTQPESVVGDRNAPFVLEARSGPRESAGDARGGSAGGGPQVRATANVAVNDGEVLATATSITEGFAAETLSVASVRSRSVTTYRAGDTKPLTDTELIIEGGRAGALSFSFDREGLRVNNDGVPLPAGQGLAALNQALEPAGLSLRFDEGRPLAGGAEAAALEILATAPTPGAGPGTVRLRLGGAMSSVALGETAPQPGLPSATIGGPPPAMSGPQAGSAVPPAGAPFEGGSGGPIGGGTDAGAAMPNGAALSSTPPLAGTSPASSEAPGPVGPATLSGVTDPPVPELLASPRRFRTASLASVVLLAAGILAAGGLVAWQARRRMRRWIS
ncbi:MAG: hypothetical protein AB1679_04390 [Actinomycetota bacterium]|jgi:hypothetical protein